MISSRLFKVGVQFYYYYSFYYYYCIFSCNDMLSKCNSNNNNIINIMTLGWTQLFPEFQSRETIIAGESYGGM